MQKQPTEKNQQEQQGLVISYFGNSVAVETTDGQIIPCHLKRNQELPVVGDQVLFKMETEENGVIVDIKTRQSLLSRGHGHGDRRPIAANIDIIAIVMAPPPIFSEYLVDRYLVAAELLHIQPIIVLNKSDLLDEAMRQAVLERLKPYQQIAYPVILSSIVTQSGLQELASYLKAKTAVLVGPSGVGKSSIIAALTKASEMTIRIGDVTPKGAGKHTTTATRLYHLPGEGGHLIDSPGVREFTLWPVSKKEILSGFKELHDYVANCKFRDCLHVIEPGCAVQEAVAHGKISAQRYESYKTLIKTAVEPTSYSSAKKNGKVKKK